MSKNLTQEEIQHKLENDEDFIYSAKYNYSLEQIIKAHPKGCKDKTIAKVLRLESPEEVETIYQDIIRKIRKKMSI